jgi:hypothetical protein
MRLSFSLLGGMLFIFFAAICIAALTSPAPMTSAVMDTIRLCFLFASILGGVLQRSQERAFWTGFAVFGWGFLGLAHVHWWGRPPLLVTSHRLWWDAAPAWVSPQNLECFYENWDSIENLVIAAAGGLVGYLFGLRRDRRAMGTITSSTLAEQDKR